MEQNTKERPILFSAPMVRAILAGTKTQTRRVFKVNGQPITSADESIQQWEDGSFHYESANALSGLYLCPYGQPGDRLWVREAWADLSDTHGQPWERRNPETGLYERGRSPFPWYRADGQRPEIGDGRTPAAPWLRSNQMPRWASRIDLEVTGVRVERLNDISEEDCFAEAPPLLDYPWPPGSYGVTEGGPKRAFQKLWESINGAGRWAADPWVWVVEFARADQRSNV